MAIKAIIWDLDGTLIHFKIDYLRARRGAIKILRANGVPKDMLSIQESILDTVRKSKEFFESSGIEKQKLIEIIEEVDQGVISVEYEAAISAKALNGIDQVLEFIRNRNLKQAIYTFNTHNNAEVSLKTVNLLQYFDFIAGRDDVENAKPHPDHLLMICNKLNVKPTESIVIGDTWRDIKGALDVGARSIAIETKISKMSSSPCIKHFYEADIILNDYKEPSLFIKTIEKLL